MPDGTHFEGYWIDGLRNGNGVETYSDGTNFKGHWYDGRKYGGGLLELPNGI